MTDRASDGSVQDPLEGADVGETRTVRRSRTLNPIDLQPSAFWGTDRQGEARIVDVDVIQDEDHAFADEVRITWEANLTKKLPRNWDKAKEPRTEAEEKSARRRKWIKRIAGTVAVVLPFGVVTAISMYLTRSALGEISINGEPMTAPTWPEMLPVAVPLFLVAMVLYYGLGGGFPGVSGVRR